MMIVSTSVMRVVFVTLDRVRKMYFSTNNHSSTFWSPNSSIAMVVRPEMYDGKSNFEKRNRFRRRLSTFLLVRSLVRDETSRDCGEELDCGEMMGEAQRDNR